MVLVCVDVWVSGGLAHMQRGVAWLHTMPGERESICVCVRGEPCFWRGCDELVFVTMNCTASYFYCSL